MGNYRKDNRGGSRDRKSSMHKAKCSECGNSCEVPFKPTSGKPVFCSDCFSAQRSSDQGRFKDRKPKRFDRGDRQMHEAICDKCGNECEVPFKPTGDKPIYCSDCFSTVDGGKGSRGSSKELAMINDKLDQILKALGATVPKEVKEAVEKKPAKKTALKKTVKKVVKKVAKKKAAKAKTKKKAAPKKAKAKAKKK